ncbi:hypothetical protein L579_0353 [Pantoea sp. AS-PWVM4]|nr:hypothetical protein L579_0353 [Pantoea sp. AS-PWVM4]
MQAASLTLLYEFSDATCANSLHYLAFPEWEGTRDWLKFSSSFTQLAIF